MLGAPNPGVRQHRRSPGSMNQRYRIGQRERIALDIGRPATIQVLRERLGTIRGVSGSHQLVCHMRPANRSPAAPGSAQHRRFADGHPQLGQPGEHPG